MKPLLDATIETLDQLRDLISALSPQDYNQPCQGSLSGVGAHVRHITDHFDAVRNGLARGYINYNDRSRGSNIENNQSLALDKVGEIHQWLEGDGLQDHAIEIETEISVNQTNNVRMPTTLSREICYLINHTVHHLAYARVVAAHFDCHLDKSIGLAPATATYLRQEEAKANA